MTADEKATWEKIKRKLAIMIDRDDALIALNRKLQSEKEELQRDLRIANGEAEYWRNKGMGGTV